MHIVLLGMSGVKGASCVYVHSLISNGGGGGRHVGNSAQLRREWLSLLENFQNVRVSKYSPTFVEEYNVCFITCVGVLDTMYQVLQGHKNTSGFQM